jgi:predicted MFS family arabinose efflux permease
MMRMLNRTAGWVTLFLIGTDLFVISPLLPGIRASLGIDVSAAALTVTVFSLAYIVGGPVFGTVADRTGHRRVLLAALALFAGANLLTALAAGFAVLLLAPRRLAGTPCSRSWPARRSSCSVSWRP